jgi:hypothetical protein
LYIRIGSIGEARDVRDRHRATQLNNDADADASQDPEDGKGQKLLPHCNRADVFTNTPVQIRSRLRDFGSLPGAVDHRAAGRITFLRRRPLSSPQAHFEKVSYRT